MLVLRIDSTNLLDIDVPKLPSGRNLAITRGALFDHGGNWVECPDGHFWYWTPAPEMGPPPYDINGEGSSMPQHALVPTTRNEAKQFIQVAELNDSGMYAWGGELLSSFPRYMELDEEDLAAWNDWVNRPETEQFIDDFIIECQRLAEVSRHARGHAVEVGPVTDVEGVEGKGAVGVLDRPLVGGEIRSRCQGRGLVVGFGVGVIEVMEVHEPELRGLVPHHPWTGVV